MKKVAVVARFPKNVAERRAPITGDFPPRENRRVDSSCKTF